MVITVIFLNLLIAIMSDSYTRVCHELVWLHDNVKCSLPSCCCTLHPLDHFGVLFCLSSTTARLASFPTSLLMTLQIMDNEENRFRCNQAAMIDELVSVPPVWYVSMCRKSTESQQSQRAPTACLLLGTD